MMIKYVLDNNPRLAIAQTLSISIIDRSFDPVICWCQYATMISNIWYIHAQ